MTVYIVDDTSFIRIICRYHVNNAGFKVIGEAYDGDVALAEIQALQPDCVLMDLALPGMNGAEIMKNVSAKYPHIQFIVVSALDQSMLKATAPEVTYTSYIRKPFEAEELVSALHKANAHLEKQKHG